MTAEETDRLVEARQEARHIALTATETTTEDEIVQHQVHHHQREDLARGIHRDNR